MGTTTATKRTLAGAGLPQWIISPSVSWGAHFGSAAPDPRLASTAIAIRLVDGPAPCPGAVPPATAMRRSPDARRTDSCHTDPGSAPPSAPAGKADGMIRIPAHANSSPSKRARSHDFRRTPQGMKKSAAARRRHRAHALPPVRPHDLRHGSAACALAADAHLRTVSDQQRSTTTPTSAHQSPSPAQELAPADRARPPHPGPTADPSRTRS